ncbi:MAG TPA: hypothetical protein VG387_01185 [Rhizomicrobium sp.]|jgi:hypothetical protein|nr:hypothetical protein [Rhizomicrobium sp.]
MSLTDEEQKHLDILETALQAAGRDAEFEKLTAALISSLLDVPIWVAKSGFQHGADSGPAGQHGRRFRIECKKYAQTTPLRERELLGEIDQALARDSALEAWFLVTTQAVPEQLAQSLDHKGNTIGVPVYIIDWTGPDVPPLAALCAAFPALVEKLISADAGKAAAGLTQAAKQSIERLRTGLQSWCLGFAALRGKSHQRLESIWSDPRISNAEFGQNAAGGATSKKISRMGANAELSSWWTGTAANDSPAIVVGFDGVGKTWAALDWLIANRDEHPVIVVVPSSAMADISSATQQTIMRVLGERLFALTQVRDAGHWNARLTRLLERPSAEGPVLSVFFDGMNQEASVAWNRLLGVLQASPFAGRVRVLASTRTHHFDEQLSKLRGLIVAPTRVEVATYSNAPGGELDQMLAHEGLTRGDLHDDLLELARTPRLFKLVVYMREKIADPRAITGHRLLWEYGRDSFGERAGRSFSESEWRAWLQGIAREYRAGITEYSREALAESTARADLTAKDVSARLSDIIDSQFSHSTPSGLILITPTLVTHGLALALLSHLSTLQNPSFEALEGSIVSWFDPIAGLDQRAEILRAAISIQVELGSSAKPPLTGPLVTAWLQTQNIPDSHREELKSLAPYLVTGLLDTVERSTASSQASARYWAIQALKSLPRETGAAFDAIVERGAKWLSIVSREMHPVFVRDATIEARRAERFIEKVGRDASGPMTVLGVEMTFEDVTDNLLADTAAMLLEGFPLAGATKCFEAGAISLSIQNQLNAWKGLKWICLLNEVDPEQTAVSLRKLSASFLSRSPENGVATLLPARAAAMTLLLSGLEDDERQCSSINPRSDRPLDYQRDYLDHPSTSYIPLERRHADEALSDATQAILNRVQRIGDLLYDPSFTAPEAFVTELRWFGEAFPIEQAHRQGSYTREDHQFEILEPALARWAPDVLAAITRRNYQSLATCLPESRYWAAIKADEKLLLSDAAASDACRALRESARENEASQEDIAANCLFIVELKGLDTMTQFERLISARLGWISVHLGEVLGKPSEAEIGELIRMYGSGTAAQQRDLVLLLSFHPQNITEAGWAWLMSLLPTADRDFRGILFRFLALANSVRFGRYLADTEWSWNPTDNLWTNHFGSIALTEAELAVPFDQLAARIAPWRLLDSAQLRGGDQAEVRLSAEIVGKIIAARNASEPDLGSDIIFDRTENDMPFSIDLRLRPAPRSINDQFASMSNMLDRDARIDAMNRAIRTAVARIEEARRSGSNLYLTEIGVGGMSLVVSQASDLIARWLEGMDSVSSDFKRRVMLAEGPYIALCEALLTSDPAMGVRLWKALKAALVTNYIGKAKISETLHMLFRVPDSQHVRALQREILDACKSDRDLFEFALAARYNKNTNILDELLAEDRASKFVWRRRRAVVMEGFIEAKSLPVAEAWPLGMIETTSSEIVHVSGRSKSVEACAHHWWHRFLNAKDEVAAYSYWVLFCGASDRRSWIWMQDDIKAVKDKDEFYRANLSQAEVNRNEMNKLMEKRDGKSAQKFLCLDIFDGVGPWRDIVQPISE